MKETIHKCSSLIIIFCIGKKKTYKIFKTKDKLKGFPNQRARFSDKYDAFKSRRTRSTNREIGNIGRN